MKILIEEEKKDAQATLVEEFIKFVEDHQSKPAILLKHFSSISSPLIKLKGINSQINSVPIKKYKETIKQAIINNLRMNPKLANGAFSKECCFYIISLLKEEVREENIGKFMYVLHCSKANYEKPFHFDTDIKSFLPSFQLLNKKLTNEENTIQRLCQNFAQNPDFIGTINHILDGYALPSILSVSSCKITFFTCSDKGLCGFTGVDSILINMSAYGEKKSIYTQYLEGPKAKEAKSFYEVKLMRLFGHEAAHYFLMHQCENLN